MTLSVTPEEALGQAIAAAADAGQWALVVRLSTQLVRLLRGPAEEDR
jgi:hypothetical protein